MSTEISRIKRAEKRRFILSAGRCRRKASFLIFICSIAVVFWLSYMILQKFPMQDLKITAVTTAETFTMTGKTDIYYLKSLDPGESYTAVITFTAVKNTSGNLFTSYGTGQPVYLGCSPLKAEYGFVSLGRSLHIKFNLSAAGTDLKLEDGTAFDITRYSLKPVLTIEKGEYRE